MMTDYFRAHEVNAAPNQGKLNAVSAILPHWQSASAGYANDIWKLVLRGDPIPRRVAGAHGLKATEARVLNSKLSARQLDSVYTQVRGQYQSWLSNRRNDIRAIISSSTVDDHVKTVLWAMNRATGVYSFREGATIPLWVDADGVLAPFRNTRFAEKIAYSPNDDERRLFHSIRSHVWKRHRRPSMRHGTMIFDGKIASVEHASSSLGFTHWLRVSTMNRGRPVLIPVNLSAYHRSRPGTIANMVQVIVHGEGDVTFKLVDKAEKAEPRSSGTTVGLDFGCTTIFATSDGRELGNWTWSWLKDRDAELTELTRALQKNGVKPSESKRYRNLQRRIRYTMTNAVNRILNQLSNEDIKEIVVEKLDFRGNGLSRRMNRLLTRTGRSAVSRKLASLEEERGIVSHEVNPAYTSQQCHGCGYVHRGNRNGKVFRCLFCGLTVNADINAARNIRERFLDGRSWLRCGRNRVRQILDSEFRQRWHLEPCYGATSTALEYALSV